MRGIELAGVVTLTVAETALRKRGGAACSDSACGLADAGRTTNAPASEDVDVGEGMTVVVGKTMQQAGCR